MNGLARRSPVTLASACLLDVSVTFILSDDGPMALRELYPPRQATNEGARRLRELLRKHSFKAIARRLRCDDKSVRSWASETSKPGLVLRARAKDVFGIAESDWDAEPSSDAYANDEPLTTKRA